MKSTIEKLVAVILAIEEDQKTNGVKYDDVVEIECPICKGDLGYVVAISNEHKRAQCYGKCGISFVE